MSKFHLGSRSVSFIGHTSRLLLKILLDIFLVKSLTIEPTRYVRLGVKLNIQVILVIIML